MAKTVLKDVWVVTWVPSRPKIFSIVSGLGPAQPARKEFRDKESAVAFAINGLDERFRATARLFSPNGAVHELDKIKAMYAALERDH
jgi:hypothetical protein